MTTTPEERAVGRARRKGDRHGQSAHTTMARLRPLPEGCQARVKSAKNLPLHLKIKSLYLKSTSILEQFLDNTKPPGTLGDALETVRRRLEKLKKWPAMDVWVLLLQVGFAQVVATWAGMPESASRHDRDEHEEQWKTKFTIALVVAILAQAVATWGAVPEYVQPAKVRLRRMITLPSVVMPQGAYRPWCARSRHINKGSRLEVWKARA